MSYKRNQACRAILGVFTKSAEKAALFFLAALAPVFWVFTGVKKPQCSRAAAHIFSNFLRI